MENRKGRIQDAKSMRDELRMIENREGEAGEEKTAV